MDNKQAKKRAKIDNDQYRAFVDEFKSETDRAAVILGAAKLDLLLYQILEAKLQPSPTGKDELLEGDAPLSSFSAKINLCFRLALIDTVFARALHITRKVRNAFAHEVSGCSLSSGAHSDRVKELVLPLKHLGFFEDMRKIFFDGKGGSSVDFRIALAIMVGRLESLLLHAECVDPSKCLPLIRLGWEDTFEEKDAKDKTQKDDKSVS